MSFRMDRNPHIAIMVAAANGRGLMLSPNEVMELAMDDHTCRTACAALTPAEIDIVEKMPQAPWPEGWKRINARTERG